MQMMIPTVSYHLNIVLHVKNDIIRSPINNATISFSNGINEGVRIPEKTKLHVSHMALQPIATVMHHLL